MMLSAASLVVGMAAGPSAAVAAVVDRGESVVFSGERHVVAVRKVDGSIVSVRQPGREGAILTGGEQGLWRARFDDGTEAGAPDCRCECEVDAGAARVRLTYRGSGLEVVVTAVGRSDGVELVGEVRPSGKAVLEFALPARLRFPPEAVERFVCPMSGNFSVGSAFRAGFFGLQPQDRPTSWRPEAAGPQGYVALFGGPLDQRADQDPAAPLTVTAEGREWLGAEVAGRVNGAQAVVNRPPRREQVELVLADSPNGPYFSASHLGGQGSLWRIGGGVGEGEAGMAADMVQAVAARLAASPAAGRGKLGLVSLTRGPANGGWASVSVREWRNRLQAVARSGELEFVELTSPGAMLGALRASDFVAILNPYGEWIPTEEGGVQAAVTAVGGYVRGGGHWFEVGGYPFHYALRPVRYFTYATTYPDAFADFLHLDSRAGSASVYRVQPQKWPPWEGARNREAIFVPGRLACGGDERGGYCDRPFATFVAPGESWRSPAVRVTVGNTAPEGLAAYCESNGIRRRLEEKMPPELLAKFKRSVLVYYAGPCREKIAHLDQLPVPTQVHFADYLGGGFDKEYPDHLPPNAGFGTPEEFRAFFDRCHELGHLVMPYTNPTWWCDHPRGPTFEREGEAPLLKGFDGKPSYERYATNDGWTVCHWHPAVQAANRKTVRQFTDEYPVDILFQDQCGARGWQYDTNPASPTPYAYTDGLISMVAEDSRSKPLSTEGGWDRVVNYESQLCGMSWAIVPTEGGPSWRTLMKHEYPPETWEVFPLAEYIAHDKTAMLYHDLGQFVTNREVLAWALGLGFSLSYRISAPALEQDGPREWLYWLDRVQKSVCARYIGEPVVAFEHDRGLAPTVEDDGVIRATYGPVAIVANVGPNARMEGGRELPPFGFHAAAPGMVAGDSSVAEGDARRAEVWVYAPAEAEATVGVPEGMTGEVTVTLDGQAPLKGSAQAGTVSFTVPAREGVVRVRPPAELAGKAPRDWPGEKPAIGVLDLGPGVGLTWTRIVPGDWVRAFEESPLAREFGLAVKRIGSMEELTGALAAGPTTWLAIVNPHGEGFPATGQGKWRETLDLIRGYVNNGGCWWETAGYSFYVAAYPAAGGWATESTGPSGMGYLGLPVGGGDIDQPAEPLRVTAEGREWLGEALSAEVERAMSTVNRGLVAGGDAPAQVTLVAGERQGFIGGYRLDGWGYLFRIGGFWPNPEVALPVAVAATEYVYTHPPLVVAPGGTRYLWHATVTR